MVGIEKHARTIDQERKLCSSGIKVETSIPVNNQHTTTATMTLVSHDITICKQSSSRADLESASYGRNGPKRAVTFELSQKH